ncbi:hypothetical protein LTR62_006232 [Meristemomyces frigidus]|uniref:non-specific serine/threonine protein kinase n=1 Tax=Meristemomyces frigidus TaxID=1508187 RepID=A0AAN7TC99_9PEZI|nr:hypothetical protein LTR62_006232 [Meristemomyces frigidus]
MGGPPGSQVAPLPSNLPFRLVSKTIGSGAYASIRKACPLHAPGPIIAVKFIHKQHAFTAGRLRPKQLQLEVSLHNSVSGHANIIRFITHGDDPNWLWMCLELASGGDLFDKIESDVGCGSEDVAHLYFVQLVQAIGWCHGKGVAHRDVKPENVLLSSDGNLKLADFGLATQFVVPGRPERKRCGMVCGSPPYIAPEILAVGQTNLKRKMGGVLVKEGYDPDVSDMWSIAIVLFVLLAGNTPWDTPEMSQYEFYDYVNSGGKPTDELWSKIPAEALSLIRGMLTVEPTERFTLHHAKKHPWYTRENPEMTAELLVANPVNLATQMMETLRIDFDAKIPPSQQAAALPITTTTTTTTPAQPDSMDLDLSTRGPLAAGWAKFASTQPDTPTNDAPFDWEAPTTRPYHGISASQPTTGSSTTATTTVTPEALLLALQEETSMSQFSQTPIGSLTATQQARHFNDIVPAHSLARFYTHYTLSAFLPLLLTALHRLNISIPTSPTADHSPVAIRLKALDGRNQVLQGSVVVERVQIRGGFSGEEGLEVLEVRFLKAKGDPVGWRRLFKQVAVLCQEAIPREKKG